MKAWRDVLACAICVGVPWVKADLGFFWSAVVPVAAAGLIGGRLDYAYRRGRRRRHGRATIPPLTSTQKESGQ